MKKNASTWILVGMIVFGLTGMYLTANYLIPKTLISLVKASPSDKISINKSYVLGGKILARANGKDKCIINVFMLNENSRGVPGKKVLLTGAQDVVAVNDVTDSFGRAVFEVTSMTEGQFLISASSDGVTLAKELKITFRN